MRFQGQTEYDHESHTGGQQASRQKATKGVLLTNLGTPDAPTSSALRTYLREFLWDPRVVEIPRLVWWLILHLFILPLRPSRSAKLYEQVWTEHGSPLMSITLQQAEALQQKIDQKMGKDQVLVKVGMRYGNPSVAGALNAFADANIHDIAVLPLYPQYCAVTSGSTFDALAQALSKKRWVPSLQFINTYHNNERYIAALCSSIQRHVDQHGMPEKLLFSYHGTPERYLQQGDPYHCYCQQTTRLVREKMGLNESQTLTTFQSRFGKAVWLQPYTEQSLKALAADGVKSVAVICPGFSADCLETLEEIEVENREYFMQAGGEHYHYIPCLNDHPEHIDMMLDLLELDGA